MPSATQQHRLAAVPLFPLPNVVLFPRAVLPLHIFEQRYRAMTADVLAGDRQLAMALLRPGWEKDYYHKPAIEPVVCVGTILTHEKLPDGKYNFLLQGTLRARVVREHGDRPYRVAQLEPLPLTSVMEIDLASQRERLTEIFQDPRLASTSIGRQFLQMLTSPLPTTDIADLVAFNFLEDIELKQSLLADGNVRQRIDRIIHALSALRNTLRPSARGEEPSLN